VDVSAYRLTPVQEGLLFYTLAEPRSRAYFGQVAFRIDGALDTAAMARAWSSTVRRHPVLRTSFTWQGAAGPLQRVHPEVDAGVETCRLQADDDEAGALEACLAAERERGFDPAHAPLTRLTHVQAAHDRHWIVWSHHHLILDGWSIPIVLADLFAEYRAALGLRGTLPPPPRPFHEYLAWLDRQDADRARDFWRQAFAGWRERRPARTMPDASDDRGEIVREIPSRELAATARRHRVTLNTVVQGAWALVLGRRDPSTDVVLGVTSAGRPFDLDGSDRMVGPFINTLPLRVAVAGAERVDAWLRELQARQARMRQFEHCPLSDIRGWIGAAGTGPLFDALIVYENYPIDALLGNELGPLGIADVRFTAWNHYPLTLRVVPHEDRLVLALLHDRRRIDDERALEMLADLEAALPAVARGMERPLGELLRVAAWTSPSFDEVEAGAHRSAEAMLIAARRRTAES
jgi:hypothetical protein